MKYRLATKQVFAIVSAVFFILGIIGGISINSYFDHETLLVLNTPRSLNGRGSSMIKQATSRPFILQVNQKQITFDTNVVNSWLETYFRLFSMSKEWRTNPLLITPYITTVARSIDQPPVNAILSTSTPLTEIKPSIQGLAIDIAETVKAIQTALHSGQSTTQAIIVPIEAEVSAKALMQRGITAHLGRGESNFVGSPSSRMHNIRTGSATFRSVFVENNTEFSFNSYLGTIDQTTGYLPELVIKGKQIVPEYGGGLCQVSTTMFRAAMFSGLPILERHPHSIPVRYYNPQGFDAAIYPGSADLRFINDTTGPILIQGQVIGTRVVFDFYGTPTGRKIVINGPTITETKEDGSIRTVLSRTVSGKDIETRRDTFWSFYHSPAEYTVIKNPLE